MAVVASHREERRPATLMPAWAARLAGFVPLAVLGALEWKRMVAGVSAGRALSWVLVAALAGVVLVACDRLPRRLWTAGVLGTAALGLLAAFAVSGLDLGLLRPARWAELGDGLGRGAEALGGVRLPYDAADPWPGLTLQLLGAVLCMLAALLTFWPRAGGRGYQFLALVSLLVLVASPVVSLGGAQSLVLGAALAALTVCFLWLERLPLRPGLGVAVLLGVALAGALPLATMADRGEPWFDYRAFAERLGPQDPIRFDWNHEYGPITWPRNGSEVMRVDSREPHYWKVRDLEDFDGTVWRARGAGQREGADPLEDLASEWDNRPAWTETFRVTVRRMRTTGIVGAGTVLDVSESTRPVRRGGTPGTWVADSELRRGDSYTVRAHAPQPTGSQMAGSTAGKFGRQGEDLELDVPFRRSARRDRGAPRSPRGVPAGGATLVFPPFQEEDAEPFAEYRTLGYRGSAEAALRRSPYLRTWRLAQRLRAQADTPFEYIVAVDRYLKGSGFGYSEVPAKPERGRAPLDAFLFDNKRGYCQHYSGAMALLLRMGGIPARVGSGFSPGGYSERRKAWIVRDTDAHSWVEAWLDAFGWVTFDPTPASTPARSQIASLEDPAPRPDSAADDPAAADAAGQSGERSRLRPDLLRDPQRATEGEAEGAAEGGGVAWWLYALAFAALAALGAALLLRRSVRTQVTALDRAIAELEAALRRAGRPASPSETLSQIERRLDLRGDAAAYIRALRSGRYAPAAPLPTRAQRRALRRELAEGLGFSGWLRALWALPPWARR